MPDSVRCELIRLAALAAMALLAVAACSAEAPEEAAPAPSASGAATIEGTETGPGRNPGAATDGAARAIHIPPLPAYVEGAQDEPLSPDAQGEIGFATRSPYDLAVVLDDLEAAPKTNGVGRLWLPEGEGPFPAMVILHGSGGIRPGREPLYARLFAERGIAGFVVDYYAPRGASPDTPYGLKTLMTSETDLVVDAYAARARLAAHPTIDGERIGVIGFSYGGMAARYALDDRLAAILAPDGGRFAAHVDFYGPCHQDTGHPGTTGAPYLAVHGDADNSVDPEACARARASLRRHGAQVEAHVFEGVGHAWEVVAPAEVLDFPYVRGCRFSFDARTGAPLLDDAPAPAAALDATRDERATARSAVAGIASHCIKSGYLIGRNEEADARAKSLLFDFLDRTLSP